MTDRTPCAFTGCDGRLDGGYCDTCGRAPAPTRPGARLRAMTTPAAPPPAPVAPPAAEPSPGSGASTPSGGGGATSGNGGPGRGRDEAGGWSGRLVPPRTGADGAPPPPAPAPAAPAPPAAEPAAPAPPAPAAPAASGPGADRSAPSRPATSPTYQLGPAPPPDGTPCPFPGCDGRTEGGYCGTCGRAPAPGAGAAASPRPRMPLLRPAAAGSGRTGSGSLGRRPGSGRSGTGSGRTGSGRTGSGRTGSGRTGSGRSGSTGTGSRRTGGTRLGLGLVDVPAVRTGDPAEALMPVAEVPEDKRYCSRCNQPVGRSRHDRPGRPEGFCPQCRARFSFVPRLTAGDLVGGQYEVLGVLAHGGLGWIYLARDKAVSDRWVVLKGLLDADSPDAAAAAVAERQFLAALDHPNIVRIYNFVTHDGAGYIVMEYVGGKSLKELLKERRDANAGRIHPLPVDRAIAYTLATLPALGYLHVQGLVFCDMKPDNVLLSGDTLKLIDLGGVRRIDDDESPIYGTNGYQAPEVADLGPSPASDLYTIGRMLAVLVLDFRGYQSTYVDSLPPPDEQPLLAEHESLHRFLLKATARDPEDRFTSAEEMAEQLLGILREEAAARGTAQPAVSTVFGPDGVVGAGEDGEVVPDWRLLPEPKVDPNDPAVGFLLGLGDGDPAAVVATLTAALEARAVPASPEALLRLARAQLDVGDADLAGATLDRLGDDRDWRVWWQRGLHAMAAGDPAGAVGWLDPVYTDLPGEVAAKLGLALAHELAGDLARSAELYDLASRTDPSYVSGAFGLARVRLAAGDREGAVAALDRVPAASSMHVAARIATVRALVAPGPDPDPAPPTPEQMERASRILDQLYLDPRRRESLARELFESGLRALAAGAPPAPVRLLGRPLTEPALREGLEATYRQLARHAATSRERAELVDQANRVRPRTLL